jgi:hypothetical protein
VTSFDEVKDIHARMAALLKYAKEVKDPAKINEAVEGRLVAEIRMGEMLLSLGERRGGDQSSREGTLPSNEELGVTKKQSSRWQQLAALSLEEPAEAIEAAKEKVAAALAKEKRKGAGKPKPSWLQRIRKLWGKVKTSVGRAFRGMITIPGTSDHHHLEFMITIVERLITIPGIRSQGARGVHPGRSLWRSSSALAEVWEAANEAERREFVLAVKPESLVAVVGVDGFMWGMSVEQCDEFDQLSAKEKGEPEKPALGPGEHLGRNKVILTRQSLPPGTVL